MAERFETGYRRLIEVRLLHHFWLDEGDVVHDLIPDQALKDRRLLEYDMRPFLSTSPTPATDELITNLRCKYKDTALGFVVAAPDGVTVPLDARFDFVITVRNPAFFTYTALTLRPQNKYEVYYQADDVIYRYKENVPLFSNLTGASRILNGIKSLFLSSDIPIMGPTDQVESLVKSGNALLQLTSDQPGASTQQLSAAVNSQPVYFNQGDVPAIVPPAGMVGAPSRGLQLTADMPDNLFAIIRVSATGAIDQDFNLVDNNGAMLSPNPVFQIRFKNRSTYWSYFDKRTRAAISVEPDPLPLTFFGNAGTRQKPSEGLIKVEQNGPHITKLVSEIFV
jgi:hypothetical protein